MAYGTDDPEIVRLIQEPDPVIIVKTSYELFNAAVEWFDTLNTDFVRIAFIGIFVLAFIIFLRRTFKKMRLDSYSKTIQNKYL